MLRFLFASVLLLSLFLSTVAACQSAMHAGIASSDSDPSLSPILSCFGQSPARASSVDIVLPVTRFSLDGCARENHLNQTLVCLGETTDLPEAPSALPGGSGDLTLEGSETSFASPALELENNINRGRTLDRNFILLHTLGAVALVADLETTVRGLQRQANGAELNPLFGAHPTRARLYGIAVPLNIFSFYVSYHYKKIQPGGNLWKLGPGISIAVHTAAAINNLVASH
jgi:hypothetical protein